MFTETSRRETRQPALSVCYRKINHTSVAAASNPSTPITCRAPGQHHSPDAFAGWLTGALADGAGRLRIALAISFLPCRSAITMVAEFNPLVELINWRFKASGTSSTER